MTGLSEWTLKHSHVGHAEAAKLLGVGPRKLWDIVHEHPTMRGAVGRTGITPSISRRCEK